MLGEIVKIERPHYLWNKKRTVMKKNDEIPLYDPNKVFPITPGLYFEDIVIGDDGITVFKTDAELDPHNRNPLTEKLKKGKHILSVTSYSGNAINQNSRALSPTIFARNPLSILTGHEVKFEWKAAPQIK